MPMQRLRSTPIVTLVLTACLLAASTAVAGGTHDHAHDDAPAMVLSPQDLRAALLPCDATELTHGRIFPEPLETTEFIRYQDAKCGLELLAEEHPERVRMHTIGESAGWENRVTGAHETFELWSVEVTNFDSEKSFEEKPKVVFQLSIHGNEKGGREGGLRLIEDFARDIGRVQAEPEYAAMLDELALVFVFPNPDGWVHEEAEYRANDACYVSATCILGQTGPGDVGAESQWFVRVNGNGFDLNRQLPTVGWANEGNRAMSQPEMAGVTQWLLNYTNIVYASDIHGMLQPADADMGTDCLSFSPDLDCFHGKPKDGHFVLSMMPAGRQTPQVMAEATVLAERVKERLNTNPEYTAYSAAPNAGVWGGDFNEYGTVWDTLAYTDGGFTSDWFTQANGLGVPGISFELSYNHITFDNHYPIAQYMNHLQVEATWDIVRAFMDQAAVAYDVTVDANGKRTLVVENPTVVTNEGGLSVDGWAAENPNDDTWDTAHRVYRAAPVDYWHDLKEALRDGDDPATLDVVAAEDVTLPLLGGYDNLVIPGSAVDALLGDATATEAVRAFAESGGTVLLTDSALRLLPAIGGAGEGSVQETKAYAGYADFVATEHPLLDGVRAFARQTFEPVPLGFSISGSDNGGLNAPIWYVDGASFDGEALGLVGDGRNTRGLPDRVTFGHVSVGDGAVVFLGAVLPDPTTEFYHPYGLDGYATTATANQIVRNALGFTENVAEVPLGTETVTAAEGEGEKSRGIPAPAPLVALLAALGAAFVVSRRR